jgi:hypothetical protein
LIFPDGFRAALEGNPSHPFQCCGEAVPIELHPDLTPEFRRRYDRMTLERATPNPVYCANIVCGQFIPPAQYRGPDSAVCEICGYLTCRLCRNYGHGGGACPEDVQMQQAEALAAANGWRRCPNCREMVEREHGCNHMTCRCGSEWCYVCGRRTWRNCTHLG